MSTPVSHPIEPQDSSPSASSQSESSQGSSLVAERILAVAGALVLRWFGKLDQEWTALVLGSAFSGPLLARAMRVLSRGKGK